MCGRDCLKPDAGNSVMSLEQEQELRVLPGLFTAAQSICTPETMANHSQHRMNQPTTSWNLTVPRWTTTSATQTQAASLAAATGKGNQPLYYITGRKSQPWYRKCPDVVKNYRTDVSEAKTKIPIAKKTQATTKIQAIREHHHPNIYVFIY